MGYVVTFGEVMLRLKPPGFERFLQSPVFEATFGGGEANVAVSLANYGLPVVFVTALPQNALGDSCVGFLKGRGVDTSRIIRAGDRLGIYFLEVGANQRPSKVIYDREGSALASLRAGSVDWRAIMAGASWFHFTGITPAISQDTADLCLEAVSVAKAMGVTVSCDYNFRKKLWRYGKKAPDIMRQLVSQVDVGIANEEDCQRALGITEEEADWHEAVGAGQVLPERYKRVCESVLSQFPNLGIQAITLRQSYSASHNGWSACLHNRSEFIVGPEYDITDVVDRVGAGDAFAAGMIYAMNEGMDDRAGLAFATAASCLKHSIEGDMNLSTLDEVRSLVTGEGSGRVQR
jgi:2-dehydro-3-deoxygluconokinase